MEKRFVMCGNAVFDVNAVESLVTSACGQFLNVQVILSMSFSDQPEILEFTATSDEVDALIRLRFPRAMHVFDAAQSAEKWASLTE